MDKRGSQGVSNPSSGQFRLSASLVGHTSDVRAVLLPDPSFAVTASRDGTTRIWKRTSPSPPTYDATESSHGAQFKTCLAFAPPSKEFADGLIISSGQDSLIEARQPTATAEQNADGFMVGHSNQVCSLDVSAQGGWIVSGSWDKSARLWQIGRWEPETELQGHTAAVWAVISYDRDTVVTGCADHAIRVFDVRGKLRTSFDGKDIIRALAKLPQGHESGGDIVSASNDGVIRIWTMKGALIAELFGHESFIYSLAVLPSGEIVSSGEDRTVRVWRGTECVQVITLPAISVWAVSTSQDGDVIAGSSDKIARIFTRSPERTADATTIAEFEESVKSSAVPREQVGAINTTDMPGPDFLQRKSGTKEGQSQMIKEADGATTLYQWSMSQQTWIKIGEVVDSAGSNSSKKTFDGKEYDYVFDIDIEDGAPSLKLPYNVTQNPYEAATKFLQDNELPLTYLEETANFIIKNTQGASLGTSSQQEAPDAWGTERRYRPGIPGEVTSSQPSIPPAPQKTLPHREYLSISVGKPAATLRQISKLNAEHVAAGRQNIALSNFEIDVMSKVGQKLETYSFSGKPSMAPSSDIESCIMTAMKVGTQWQPLGNRLAGLDLLRFLAAALKSFPNLSSNNANIIEDVLTSGAFEEEFFHSNTKLAMISLRFFANLLYASDSGRAMIQSNLNLLLHTAQVTSSMASSDVSLAVALTTFYLNLAVFITNDKSADPEPATERGLTIVDELVKILSSLPAVDHKATAAPLAQSTEPAYRGIMALGTVLVGLRRQEIVLAAKQIFDVPALLDQLKRKNFLTEPRFQNVVREIKAALA